MHDTLSGGAFLRDSPQQVCTALVKPGEKLPTDGAVVAEQTSVNEAMLTRDGQPVEKGERATVIAGAVNGEAAITGEVQKTGDEIYLSQVIGMVRPAQESRSRSQDLSEGNMKPMRPRLPQAWDPLRVT